MGEVMTEFGWYMLGCATMLFVMPALRKLNLWRRERDGGT